MASADQFFRRLRARVRSRTTAAPAAPAPPGEHGQPATRERFFDELAKLGANPHIAERARVAELVLQIARASASKAFVAWQDGLVDELAVAAHLVANQLHRIESADRSELANADLAVSGCDLAFAENGALLLCTNEARGRLLTALPRVHVVLVGSSQLIYGLESLPGHFRHGGLPSAALLHTGPTFSGDVEAIVIIGAHGPAELHVIWIEDHK